MLHLRAILRVECRRCCVREQGASRRRQTESQCFRVRVNGSIGAAEKRTLGTVKDCRRMFRRMRVSARVAAYKSKDANSPQITVV